MEEILRKSGLRIIAASIIAIIITIAFTVPLGTYTSLGDLLFPGDGLWTIPTEVPEYETISSSDLSADVTVYRDEWGIPHIYGNGEKDIMFALGYCHAQDRWFQMDMIRRNARGMLSEILGPSAIEDDKFSLMKMEEYWANQTLIALETEAATDPKKKKILDALQVYVKGVNTFLTTHPNDIPFEYKFLNAEIVPWSELDTFIFVKYMSEYFTWGYSDMRRFEARMALGEDNYTELFGFPQPYQIPVCPNYGNYSDIKPPISVLNSINSEENPNSASSEDEQMPQFIGEFMDWIEQVPGEKERMERAENEIIGSNNWAVHGNKTATGAPFLENDMHLGWTLPGLWYEAHLIDISEETDLNAYGVFLPGVPLLIEGHTEHVAWGMTIAPYDLIDWYYYNGINDTHYVHNGEPTEYEFMDFSINVKGQDPVDFTVNFTKEGPVFSGLVPTATNFTENPIACRWLSQSVTWDILTLYDYLYAKNITTLNESTRYFDMLPVNIAFADSDGNIGIRPNAKIPIRNDSDIPSWHTGGGSMPYNGSKGEGNWTGYVPFEDRPFCINPEQGYLCSANQYIAGPDYENVSTINSGGAMGYRARRINDVLASKNQITLDDMINLTLDVYDVRAAIFTPYLLDAMDNHLPSKTALQQAVYTELDNWDYNMDKDEAAPTILSIWFEAYWDGTFGDEMDFYNCPMTPSPTQLENYTRNDPTSKWFDDITTLEVENSTGIMLDALDIALDALVEFYGNETISEWLWGSIHRLGFFHLAGISSLSAGPYPGSGSGITVTPAHTTNLVNGEVVAGTAGGGSSERFIVDFSDLNNSVSVIPSGQRGISTSKHYIDQLEELFLQGKYHRQYFDATTAIEYTTKNYPVESTIEFKAIVGGA